METDINDNLSFISGKKQTVWKSGGVHGMESIINLLKSLWSL